SSLYFSCRAVVWGATGGLSARVWAGPARADKPPVAPGVSEEISSFTLQTRTSAVYALSRRSVVSATAWRTDAATWRTSASVISGKHGRVSTVRQQSSVTGNAVGRHLGANAGCA